MEGDVPPPKNNLQLSRKCEINRRKARDKNPLQIINLYTIEIKKDGVPVATSRAVILASCDRYLHNQSCMARGDVSHAWQEVTSAMHGKR